MKVLIIVLLTVLMKISHGQIADNTRRQNEGNIYYQALTQYLQFVKAERARTIDTIFLEEGYLTDSLLLQSGQTIFVKLKYKDIPEHLKTHRSLTLYRLFPMQYKDGEFSVSFVPFGVSYNKKKRNTHYVNPGSYRIVYRFEANKFTFLRVEGHGI